jgi:hypothetical protein
MIQLYCDRAEVIQPKLACQSIEMVLTDDRYGIGKVYSWGKEPSDPWKHWATIKPLYEDYALERLAGGAEPLHGGPYGVKWPCSMQARESFL